MDINALIENIFRSNVINTIIVIGILSWLIKRFRVLAVLNDKQKAINIHINNSEENKSGADLKLKETVEKVKNTDLEVLKISKEAQEVAKALSEKIVSDAQEESDSIHDKSLKLVEAEKDMATGDITKQVAGAAFMIAEEHIKQAIDAEMHKKYINEFIDNLESMKV